MNYYVRESYDSETRGPFSLEDINEALAANKVDDGWIATADLGEDLKRIKSLREHDWTPLSRIPGTSVYSGPVVPVAAPANSLPFDAIV